MTDEIGKKISHTMGIINQIMAQYGQGSREETATETFERRLSEWEAKWKDMQTSFRQITPGVNLNDETFNQLKLKVVKVSQQLVHWDVIYDVDMF